MSRATFIRGRVGRYLLDSYTRHDRQDVADDTGTPTVDESTDAWGNPIIVYETPLPVPATSSASLRVPCMWVGAGAVIQTMSGTFIEDTPTMYVASNDPLQIGDHVSNIIDAEGVVRLVGPARITDMPNYGPPGYTALRAAKLTAAKVS